LRERTQGVYFEIAENPYDILLAVLVDGLSVSSVEEFVGAIQVIDRGAVVGEFTPGAVSSLTVHYLALDLSNLLIL
jgi:C-terminal processing protease CtpA/Prc